MSTSFSNQDDVIDSRDIIARIEELESELGAVEDNFDETEENEAYNQAVHEWHASNDGIELKELQALADECEGYSDWQHGETLIRQDYFVQYITELIGECYEMPEMEGWPMQYLTMDYEAAAGAAEQDYALVSSGDQDYWIRSC